MSKDMRVQSISQTDIIRLHFLSFAYGVWVLFKKFAKLLWIRKSLDKLQLRDNPPSCLVDSSIGQHKYVKLKVRIMGEYGHTKENDIKENIALLDENENQENTFYDYISNIGTEIAEKGIKFHYVEAGPKEQPLLLFLHGFPDCWLTWRFQIPVFAKDFRVIALDMKGFGDSDKPHWRSSYKVEVIIEELKQFIHSLGVQECSLIGHDLGALVGWYLVHLEPNLVSKFFAVSCPHPNTYWKSLMNIKSFKWLNFVQVPYLPEIDAMKEDIKLINEYHKHLPDNDIYLEAYKYTFSRQEDWTGPINYYRNLLCKKVNDNGEPILPTVILITGNEDKLFKLEGLVKSTEFCNKYFMKIIDGAEHFPHQECPDKFNKILLTFLTNSANQKLNENNSQSRRLIKGLFGAVTNTVKYGNLVVGSVHERASGVVGNLSSAGLLPFHYSRQSDP